MSKSITIRDVPDEMSDELAARAALTGRTPQEYLRGRIIELAGRPDPKVWVAQVGAPKATSGGSINVEQLINEWDDDDCP